MDDEIEKPVRLPKLIVLATLPEDAKAAIEEGDLETGLAPAGYAPGEQPGIGAVMELLPRLKTALQRDLLRGGLLHAYGSSHGGKASFYRLEIDYQIDGIALDITDRAVDEDGTCGPVEFIFGVPPTPPA